MRVGLRVNAKLVGKRNGMKMQRISDISPILSMVRMGCRAYLRRLCRGPKVCEGVDGDLPKIFLGGWNDEDYTNDVETIVSIRGWYLNGTEFFCFQSI